MTAPATSKAYARETNYLIASGFLEVSRTIAYVRFCDFEDLTDWSEADRSCTPSFEDRGPWPAAGFVDIDTVFDGTGELECKDGSSAASSSLRR